jgi:hypothetical protein
MSINFREKYIKYKEKYLNLKNIIGSGSKSGIDGQVPPFDHEEFLYFYVLLGDGSGNPEKKSSIITANDGRFVNGHVAIGMNLTAEEMADVDKINPGKLIMDKIPIIGFGPLLPSEIYDVRANGIIYLKDAGLRPEFWEDFKTKSYNSPDIETKYPLRAYYDTKLFHFQESEIDPANLEKQKNRKLYRFKIYPNLKREIIRELFINLLKKSINPDINKTIIDEKIKYGILKNQEICFGSPEYGHDQSTRLNSETEKYQVFNCITAILNFFKPYIYRKDTIRGKQIYSKVHLDLLGTSRCARIRYLALHVLNHVEDYSVYTAETGEYRDNSTKDNLNNTIGLDTL